MWLFGNVCKQDDLHLYLNELTQKDCCLIKDIEYAVKNETFFNKKKWKCVYEFGLYRVLLYIIVRSIKPKIFIETGVLHGLTSNFILYALKKNKFGNLISIDLPSYFNDGPSNNDGFYDTLPPNREPGWIINNKYKKYWLLLKGSSSEMLPEILKKYQSIDMFLHDSDHTYENMQFELEIAWKYLSKNGYIICDNIDTNSAFFDFCYKVRHTPLIFPEATDYITHKTNFRFGIIQKNE